MPEGIDLTIEAAKAVLTPDTDKFKDLLLLEGRYREVTRQLLQGVLSNEDAQLEFNKIRKALLDFIDTLQEAWLLSSDAAPADDRPDIYNGEVFYRIPKKMQMEQEVKCVVRLAFDRKVIVEDIEVEEEDVLKDLRISEVMGVELLDTTGESFKIRTLNDTVQFVDKDLYTEWLFFVKPIAPGTHPLTLKISIIEMKNGVERKRNVVLEEQVVVITEPVPEEEGELKKSAVAVQMGQAQAQTPPSAANGGGSSGPKAPSPSPLVDLPKAPAAGGGNFKKIATALSALVVVVVAAMVVWNNVQSPTAGPGDVVVVEPPDVDNPVIENPEEVSNVPSPEVEAWELAQVENTRAGYEDFLRENPSSNYTDAAMMRLDSIELAVYEAAASIAMYKEYIQQYPNGAYVAKAQERIKDLQRRNSSVEQPAPEPETPTTPGRTNQPEPRDEIRPATEQPTVVNPNGDEPVPMRKASRRPIYKGCDNDNKQKEEACTKKKIYRYLKDNLEYPREAQRRRIEGTVLVEFTVEKDGRITNIQYSNDPGGGCAKEAVRLVQGMPKFKPGLNRAGQPIRVRYTQPITFKLR